MIVLGQVALVLALGTATWAMVAAWLGRGTGREAWCASAARGLLLSAAFTAVALVVLLRAFATHDFTLQAVARGTSLAQPRLALLPAVWTSAPGGLLLQAVALAVAAALVATAPGRAMAAAVRATLVPLAATLAALLAAIAWRALPFARVTVVPDDGRGLDPLLQHPALAVLPWLTAGGVAAATVAAARVVGAATARGHSDPRLRGDARRALLAASALWVAALVATAWWRGDTGAVPFDWDPGELATVLPLLLAAVASHRLVREAGPLSPVARQLVVLPAVVAWLATALARGGRFVSEVAYGRTLAADGLLAIGVGIALAGTWAALAGGGSAGVAATPTTERRWPLVAAVVTGGAAALVVASGLFVPVVKELWGAPAVRLAPAFFVPLVGAAGGAALAALATAPLARGGGRAVVPSLLGAGVGGLAAWGAGLAAPWPLALIALSCGAAVGAWRAGDALPARLAHTGVVGLALWAAGGLLARDETRTLTTGGRATVRDAFGRDWTVTSQGASFFNRVDHQLVAVSVELRRGSRRVGFVSTEQRQYGNTLGETAWPPHVVPALVRGVAQETQVALAGTGGRDAAILVIRFRPFAAALWLGGALLGVGLLAAWGAPVAARDEAEWLEGVVRAARGAAPIGQADAAPDQEAIDPASRALPA